MKRLLETLTGKTISEQEWAEATRIVEECSTRVQDSITIDPAKLLGALPDGTVRRGCKILFFAHIYGGNRAVAKILSKPC